MKDGTKRTSQLHYQTHIQCSIIKTLFSKTLSQPFLAKEFLHRPQAMI